MKKWGLSALVVSLCAGCAQTHESLVGLAALREDDAAAPERSAYVWRHRLAANQKYMARYPTLASVQGEGDNMQYHNFSVIFGLPDGLNPLDVRQGGQPEAEGMFKNPEPSWEIVTGYGMIWGWWPIGYTPFVRVGSEGRSAFLFIVQSANLHRVVLLSGEKIGVTARDGLGDAEEEIETANFVIDAKIGEDGHVDLTAPYELPAADPLVPVIEKLKLMQRFAAP